MCKRWIVVNVGCIECGVSTNIVGVFTDKEQANNIASEFSDKFNWRQGGQNSFEVFEMPKINTINKEYMTECE